MLKTSVSSVKHLSDHSMHGCCILRLRLLLYIAEEGTVVPLNLQHSISSYCNVPIIGVNIISEMLKLPVKHSSPAPNTAIANVLFHTVDVLHFVYKVVLILL